MTVNSADKKPEKYIGPDGKAKIRMVPVDKEVVKSEAYDEPQGQAKRMMSPLQKIRMDKEKADRDRDGKLKSTNKTFKALRKESVELDEISPELQKRYKTKAMKQYKQSARQKEVGLGVAKQATADKHMKIFMKRHKGIGSAIKRQGGSPMTNKDPKANSMTSKPAPYKKESVDEVLDTPGAMDRYHNKAKAQSDRARNSATAKIVRGTKDISKEKDVIRKREKGMDMATNVRAKQFRKAVTGKPYGEAVEENMNPYLKHPTNKLKDKHASFSRQIGDLQTKKLKGAKNPSIDQEIAKYQQKLRHVKNAMDSKASIQNESLELEEAATPQMKKAAAGIEAYAKKHGGIDKTDFMKAAKMLSSGNAGTKFIKFVNGLDTDPREWLITNLAKTMGKQTVEKMFKVKIREKVQLDELEMNEAPKKKKYLTYKDMKKAIASIKPPKKKPTLPKAPWDKKDD